MPAWAWGATTGVIAAIALGVFWTEGGAGVALLVPVFALFGAPVGAFLGWLVGALKRRGARSRRTS